MKKILLVCCLMAAFMLGACSTGAVSEDSDDRLQIVYSTMTEKNTGRHDNGSSVLVLIQGRGHSNGGPQWKTADLGGMTDESQTAFDRRMEKADQ